MVLRQQEDQSIDAPRTGLSRARIFAGIAVLCVLIAIYIVLQQTRALDHLLEGEALKLFVMHLGLAGPALIIGLMTIAIVMSPIPSAPIALAAGAAYGHVWGTLYVAIGSEAGALIAFGLARFVGYEAVRAWLGARPSTAFLNRFMHSQNGLMAVVFATRLMPFLSFDIVSYAAGLTPLKIWRFALATLLGIIPASFLLAHFGDEMVSGELHRAGLAVLALGSITLLPLAWKIVPGRYKSASKRWFTLKSARQRPEAKKGIACDGTTGRSIPLEREK